MSKLCAADKDEEKPEWAEAAEKKKEFVQEQLQELDKGKGAFSILNGCTFVQHVEALFKAHQDSSMKFANVGTEKGEETPEWAEAAKKKKEFVKGQLDELDKGKGAKIAFVSLPRKMCEDSCINLPQ